LGRDEREEVRRGASSPGELEGFTCNDVGRGSDGKSLSEGGGDERSDESGNGEGLHCGG